MNRWFAIVDEGTKQEKYIDIDGRTVNPPKAKPVKKPHKNPDWENSIINGMNKVRTVMPNGNPINTNHVMQLMYEGTTPRTREDRKKIAQSRKANRQNRRRNR